MYYEYKMVQIPPSISIKAKDARGQEAAWYLQEIINTLAGQGWEFYRIDTVGVVQNPGCLGSLFGASKVFYSYYVVSFRKEKTVQNISNVQPHAAIPPTLPQ